MGYLPQLVLLAGQQTSEQKAFYSDDYEYTVSYNIEKKQVKPFISHF